MDVVKIVLSENICEHCWFQISNLGLEKGKEYFAYINDKGVEVEINGINIQLEKNEFFITETTSEIRKKVRKAKEKGIFIKLIN